MKSYVRSFRKKFIILLKGFLVVLCLFALVSCSSGGEEDPSGIETENKKLTAENEKLTAENEKLTAENEKLRTELVEANNELETAEVKVKELEDDLEAMQEAQPIPSSSVPVEVDITPPERTPSELLLGQWFWQEFHEEGFWSYIQILVFDTGGTGTISRIYYIPEDEIDTIPYIDGEYLIDDVDVTNNFSWTLNGDILHIAIENGEVVDFIYSASQQEITLENTPYTFGREKPTSMEGYVERSLYSTDYEAKEAARRRRFLGTWYYDVLTFTFNEDGTGVWDIPELGNQPAEKHAFTYKVDDIDGTLCLKIDWEDFDYWTFFTTFNGDGSMSLTNIGQSDPIMKWTRAFDPDNCPVTAQIISNQMDVFTGSIFSDMLNGALGGD